MRALRKNSPEQIQFAKDLEEMTGVNLLDGRHIATSISLHQTAEMNRVESKKKVRLAISKYLHNGGKITVLPPR